MQETLHTQRHVVLQSHLQHLFFFYYHPIHPINLESFCSWRVGRKQQSSMCLFLFVLWRVTGRWDVGRYWGQGQTKPPPDWEKAPSASLPCFCAKWARASTSDGLTGSARASPSLLTQCFHDHLSWTFHYHPEISSPFFCSHSFKWQKVNSPVPAEGDLLIEL